MNASKCILCNSSSFVKLFTKGKWDIVKCNNCNLMFADPLPSESEIEYFYNNIESDKEGIVRNLKQRNSRERRNGRKLKLLEKIQGSKGTMLDVGCGLGLFVKNASDMGWVVQGIDVNKDLIKYGKDTFNINLCCTTLKKAEFPNGHFDVITTYNLLDHLREPLLFLREIERVLKPGGIIDINVHDAGGWKAKKDAQNWGAYCPPGHLYFYSYKTLGALLNKAGLRFLMVPGINFKEGIKMIAVKRNDSRKRSYPRRKFERFIYSCVQIFKL